ncbi:hypothetical protein MO973_16300 [Paenibacillus sp. TRM 82003]|uniref:hypothetical protein n=1 Tax=Kineococcus sp. TRM81007 TaxID=2925831 RepID=UPI001F567821|nr:hypothetical protein [Kineococcus sp. TRM81007]MCI2237774.1 hypothetical protein [Kineococcus sp. TRM81007]MCI3921793.1 hypothetical protein [Paenibacillus sp. TRM 82003]
MDLLLLLTLASLPAGGVVVLVAFVSAVSTAPRHRTATLLASAGAGLAAVWVVVTYRGGIRADETGTSYNMFSDAGWLLAAAVLSVVSLVLNARRHRRTARTLSSTCATRTEKQDVLEASPGAGRTVHRFSRHQ